MESEEIQKALVEFISKDLLDSSESIKATDCFEDLSLGSIEIMEIIFFLEKEFKIKLDAEVFREGRLKSVESLSNFLFNFTAKNPST